ncbi:hypothetical protein FRC07_004612 [Ceratobasidium sp. 392]|nr:hypothetical protein FRC07_004612 [Ceratobasidium sp. 392]
MGCIPSKKSIHPEPPTRSLKPSSPPRHLVVEPFTPPTPASSTFKPDSLMKEKGREADSGHHSSTVEAVGVATVAVVGFSAAAYAFDAGAGGDPGGDSGAGGGDGGGDGGGGGE